MSASVWDWYYDYAANLRASERCTSRHRQMLDLFDEHSKSRIDPRIAVVALKQASSLGRSFKEDQFTLWCDVWLAMVWSDAGNMTRARQTIANAATESRKTIYIGTPQQMMANVLLADVLAGIDPVGYEHQIRSAFEFVRNNCGELVEHISVAAGALLAVVFETQRLEEFEELNRIKQDITSRVARSFLWRVEYDYGRVAFLREEWTKMLSHVDSAKRLWDRDTSELWNGSMALMRAAALSALHELPAAQREYRRGWKIRSSIAASEDYLFATWYWLHQGKVDKAIEIRLKQQEDITNKSRYWEQAAGAKHLYQLYLQIDNQVEAKRWRRKLTTFCKRLRDPTLLLAVL